jgi:hypothetical protein
MLACVTVMPICDGPYVKPGLASGDEAEVIWRTVVPAPTPTIDPVVYPVPAAIVMGVAAVAYAVLALIMPICALLPGLRKQLVTPAE